MDDTSIDQMLFGADADDTDDMSVPPPVADPLVLGTGHDSLLFDTFATESPMDSMSPFDSFDISDTLPPAATCDNNARCPTPPSSSSTGEKDPSPYFQMGESLFTTSTSAFPKSFQLTDDLSTALQGMLQSDEVNQGARHQNAASGDISPLLLHILPQSTDSLTHSMSLGRSDSVRSASLGSSSSRFTSVTGSTKPENQLVGMEPLPSFASSTATNPFNFSTWNSVHPFASGISPVDLNLSHNSGLFDSLAATSVLPMMPTFSPNVAAANPTVSLLSNSLSSDSQQPSLPSLFSSSSSSVPQLDTNSMSGSMTTLEQLLSSASSMSQPLSPSSAWLINAARYATSMGYPLMTPATASKLRRSSWLPGLTPKANHRIYKRHSQPSLTPFSFDACSLSSSLSASPPPSTSSMPTPKLQSTDSPTSTTSSNTSRQQRRPRAAGRKLSRKMRPVTRPRQVVGIKRCPVADCGYLYNLTRELSRHMQTHLFAKSHRYVCQHCQAGLCRLDAVKRHMEAKGKQDCLTNGTYGEYDALGQLVHVRKCKKSWYESAAVLRAQEKEKGSKA